MMHSFVCVAYLMIICSAHPPKGREPIKTLEKRSLFHDVIQSLRIRAQLPENTNEDNNLEHTPDRYGFDNELLQLPRDTEFMPRRNDRIEMPSLKYRTPKSLVSDNHEGEDKSREEITLYIHTPDDAPETTTQKPKRQKRPRPNTDNKMPNKYKDDQSIDHEVSSEKPFTNHMAGQSQIGNRESQTVVKPTVIVNFRGSVSHRESEIRIERRKTHNGTTDVLPQNIFNIKQEIKLDKSDAWMGSSGGTNKHPAKINQDVHVSGQVNSGIDEDMMMCETSVTKQGKRRSSRNQDVFQIVVNV